MYMFNKFFWTLLKQFPVRLSPPHPVAIPELFVMTVKRRVDDNYKVHQQWYSVVIFKGHVEHDRNELEISE